jgi:hypothetical protein
VPLERGTWSFTPRKLVCKEMIENLLDNIAAISCLIAPILLFLFWYLGKKLLERGVDPRCLFRLPVIVFLFYAGLAFSGWLLRSCFIFKSFSNRRLAEVVVLDLLGLMLFLGLGILIVWILLHKRRCHSPDYGGSMGLALAFFSCFLIVMGGFILAYPSAFFALWRGISSWRKGDPFGMVTLALLIPVLVVLVWATLIPVFYAYYT